MTEKYPSTHVYHYRRTFSNAQREPQLAILYITNKLCFPPNSGGAVREWNLLKPLLDRFDIHYIGLTQDFESDLQNVEAIKTKFASLSLLRADPTDAPATFPLRVREHYSRFGKELIGALIEEIDPWAIHVEGYFLMHYIGENCSHRIVLTEENIEFALDADKAAVLNDGSADNDLIQAARALEIAAWKKADACVFVTPADETVALSITPSLNSFTIENGIEPSLIKEQTTKALAASNGPTALYVANYGWAPSEDAAYFLLEEVWPLIHVLAPEAKLILAGSGMNEKLLARARRTPQVKCVGVFDQFSDVASDASVFICPLRFGGGSKVKVIDALSHGLPVVGTIECERGFPPTVSEMILRGETPRAIALLTVAFFDSIRTRKEVIARIPEALASMPTWKAVSDRLADVWGNRFFEKGA
ncbi:glycosyltransferase (plasmid) [Agrobacterium salinitolerans]|uniref:glycosyltransferase n=1 Tax=Agrobacterium salinitolerans TaxID=1183413 RepID=UPI001C21B265|nr:glycosyltransferase [Agrobacterium salinitolerans]QXC52453.1 glycosyltransferase [Agrobacterium salinitolerans]